MAQTSLRNDPGKLRASVASLLDEYMALGVQLTPHQVFHQLVARGVMEDTPADLENLLAVLPSEHGGTGTETERNQRLKVLKDAILKAGHRFEQGEPHLLEDVQFLLRRALDPHP